MIGPFDKPAELRIQPLPFELMFQMAEKRQQRADKTQETAGALSGAFASLQSAPGHEGYKVETLKPYQDALQQFMKKYPDMSDPRALRELTNIKSAFQNDPNIHNIVESKQTYDKLLPEMYKAKNTGAVFTGSIFDREGNIQANKQRYTPEQLSFIPQADINPEIDAQLAKVHPHITQGNFLPKISYMKGPNGEDVPMIQQGQTITERKSYQEFNKAIEAITESIMQGNTDGSRYYIAKNGTGDYASTREIVRQQVLRNAIPFFYQNTKTDLSHSQFVGKEGEESSFTPPGMLNTIDQQYDVTKETSEELKNIHSPANFKQTPSSSPFTLSKVGGEFVPDKTYDPIKTYQSLTPLTRNRLEFLKQNDPVYKNKDIKNFTEKDYKHFDNILQKEYKGVKVSDNKITFKTKEESDQWKDFFNRNKTNFFFYDPEQNKVISGTQLNDAGIKIESASGVITNNTYTNIPTDTKYKFTIAFPVTASLSDGSSQRELLVGLNKAQIVSDPGLYKSTLMNEISAAHKMMLPTSLFGSNIIVIPESSGYSFSLDFNDGTEPTYYHAETEKEYRDKIDMIINNSTISSKLFKSLQ